MERRTHPFGADLAVFAALACWACLALAQGNVSSVFVCTDARGQRITSDRPIPECADREQQEITPAGVVKRVIPGRSPAAPPQVAAPSSPASRHSAELEQQRKDRALLVRYANQTQHDAERAKQLAMVDDRINAINSHTQMLQQQAKALQDEMEFYRRDPSKAPAWLKQRVTETEAPLAQQAQRLAEQEGEKQRIHARFDEELARLKQLWAARGAAPAALPR